MYIASWCQSANAGLPASLMRKPELQHKTFGPYKLSTTSR